jgi:F-type H+-transporting ATPase subunit b
MAFNSWTFVFEIVNFLALVYVLHRLLYRPMLAAIDARRQAIVQAQEAAGSAQREAAALKSKLEADAQAAEGQRLVLLAKARQEAEEERRRIVAAADGEIGHHSEMAQQRLTRDREAMLRELREYVVREALNLSSRLLAEVSDADLDARLAGKLVDTLRHLSASDRDRLVAGWLPDKSAVLQTAHALDDASVQTVRSAIGEVLGRDLLVHVEIEPALVSGVRLQLDGHVWDASLLGVVGTLSGGAAPSGDLPSRSRNPKASQRGDQQ